ncbi:hypothetical protein Tco_0664205 [Tanacetum coccineum]
MQKHQEEAMIEEQKLKPTLKETQHVTEDDIVADIMGRHDHFMSSMQSRLAKLQSTKSMDNQTKHPVYLMENVMLNLPGGREEMA